MKTFLIFLITTTILNATVYTGQANGSTQSEAKQNALKDISEQISVSIDTETKQDKKLIDGKYSQDIVISTSQSSNTNIVGYELISMNFKDGIYTIKLQYENIPSLDKFAKKVPYSKKDILKSIKKDFGYSLGKELIRKDKKWYIKYKDFEAIPQAGLLEKGKDTFDMYVAVLSPKKLIFDQFAIADGNI